MFKSEILFLLQILFDLGRLAQEERNMLLRIGDQGFEDMGGLLEFLEETFVFLVAPGVAQGRHA